MSENQRVFSPDLRALAEFRYQIRKFLRLSEEASHEAGIEPQQYQLLLAVKGMPDNTLACIGTIAERLQIQHHSTVELIDRLEQNGYVVRQRSERDKREVLIVLTAKADHLLEELSFHHQELLQKNGARLIASLNAVFNPAKNMASNRRDPQQVGSKKSP